MPLCAHAQARPVAARASVAGLAAAAALSISLAGLTRFRRASKQPLGNIDIYTWVAKKYSTGVWYNGVKTHCKKVEIYVLMQRCRFDKFLGFHSKNTSEIYTIVQVLNFLTAEFIYRKVLSSNMSRLEA